MFCSLLGDITFLPPEKNLCSLKYLSKIHSQRNQGREEVVADDLYTRKNPANALIVTIMVPTPFGIWGKAWKRMEKPLV